MMVQRIALSILSSVLLWVSFPSADLHFFSWIGFIPLCRVLSAASKPKAFLFSYLSGFLFFLLILSWLRHVTVLGLIILCLYLAFYFALFGYFFVVGKRQAGINFRFIIFVSCVWVVVEYCRSQLLTGFPWALLGYAQYRSIPFIQFADITGIWGVSFVVMFVNLCSFFLLQSFLKREKRTMKKCIAALAVVFIVTYGYGFYSLKKYSKKEETPSLDVAVIQGNIAQDEKWENVFRPQIKENYSSLSKEASRHHPDLLIWPETSYPDYIVSGDDNAFDELFEIVHATSGPLLCGAVLEEPNRYFNAAFLLAPTRQPVTVYKKIHLVPFGEYVPLRNRLHFLEDIVPIGDFTAGSDYTLFSLRNKKEHSFRFGVLICFEDTLFELARQFRLRGADFFVNITNDAWFKKSAGPYQHVQASVFRAVENRAYLARAANTGISCIIDDTGRVLQRLRDEKGKDIFVRGFLEGKINAPVGLSVYTKWGDWFVVACALYMITFLIYLRKKI